MLDHHTHEDVPHSPGAILRKQLRRLQAMKMKAYMASELEFFLFDDSYELANQKGYRNLKTAGYYIEDYHILQTSKEEVYMRALRNGSGRLLVQRGEGFGSGDVLHCLQAIIGALVPVGHRVGTRYDR